MQQGKKLKNSTQTEEEQGGPLAGDRAGCAENNVEPTRATVTSEFIGKVAGD